MTAADFAGRLEARKGPGDISPRADEIDWSAPPLPILALSDTDVVRTAFVYRHIITFLFAELHRLRQANGRQRASIDSLLNERRRRRRT